MIEPDFDAGGTADAGAEQLLRTLAPQVLGAVIRRFGDFASAEDAVQEALLAAAMQWPEQGVPEHPRAWLIQVASRRMTDHVRREIARRRRETVVFEERRGDLAPAADRDAATAHDDTLILLFMCAHPALSEHATIALTLRAVGGLTTAEIASAFLVPESTMAQRISRAKQAIRKSGVPFSLPGEGERAARLTAVLHVLYLIFSEGYVSSAGAMLTRADLATEAIRLTRAVQHLLPQDPEVAGLLALMLLTDARRDARTGEEGELIPLAEQDRARWNHAAIEEGVALITATLARGAVGPYQLQAAIAALHDEAARAEDTDWPQILALYGLLERMTPNPMITLNRAIAAAMVDGPGGGPGDGRSARHRHPPRRPLSARRGPRPPPRDGRRSGDRARPLPRRGRQDGEHPGAELPDDEGGDRRRAPRRPLTRSGLRARSDEAARLAGQREPCVLVAAHRDPFLHQAAVAGVEELAVTEADELVDAGLGQLRDEHAAREHREDLPVYLEADGGHHLSGRDVGVAAERGHDRGEARVDLCGIGGLVRLAGADGLAEGAAFGMAFLDRKPTPKAGVILGAAGPRSRSPSSRRCGGRRSRTSGPSGSPTR